MTTQLDLERLNRSGDAVSGQDVPTVARDVPRYSLTLSAAKEIRWITPTSATTTSTVS
jgi:hypothetical protein